MAKVYAALIDGGAAQPDNNQAGILLAVPEDTDVFSEAYAAAITSSGAGVLAQRGLFVAHLVRSGDAYTGLPVVMVRGSFTFTRAAAGVAETITISLPPTMQPTAVFPAATSVTGQAQMAGIHAATDFCGTLIAVVGARTVSVPITDNAASSVVDVFFSYAVAVP